MSWMKVDSRGRPKVTHVRNNDVALAGNEDVSRTAARLLRARLLHSITVQLKPGDQSLLILRDAVQSALPFSDPGGVRADVAFFDDLERLGSRIELESADCIAVYADKDLVGHFGCVSGSVSEGEGCVNGEEDVAKVSEHVPSD